jgi:glucose/arabinose dehydrogenase
VLQAGRIVILENGALYPQAFLDIDSLVPNISGWDERGLLGLAFHPEYASNGFFYVNYINLSGATTIARYTVSADPNVADPGSAAIVLVVPQPFSNHNGGTLAFGPQDGYLYIGMGDGGSFGDPGDRAQNDGELLGKMLRIDVDSGSPYAIPPDNPFVGPGDPLDEIWAKGLRNPYRFCFDRVTGDLYIADVGQNEWEELDFQYGTSAGGENYGWRLMEGNACYNPPVNCAVPGLTMPVHVYSHDLGCSITGGAVYRGSAVPQIYGHYFFADFCGNQIWSVRVEGGQVVEFDEWTSVLAPGGGFEIGSISAIGEDGRGELYIVDRTGEQEGEIYRITSSGTGVQDGVTGSWGGVKAGFRGRR